MESNAHNFNCEFEPEIVAYLYDELDASGRGRFETHLADCTPCTDEFAELSFARFSVFEWQKEEFAPLKTPTISIPYPTRAAEKVNSAGFFAGVREALAFNWQTSLAAAGILAICIGIGFALMNNSGTVAENIASADVKKETVKPTLPTVTPNVPESFAKVDSDEQIDIPETNTVRSVSPTKIAAEVRKPRTVRVQPLAAPRISDDVAERIPESRRRNAPALTAETDDDDRSLRLTDLFDEDDARL